MSMSKPTALILNDTSNAYHWGCYGTSTEIRLSLEDAGYKVSLFSVADVHGLKTPPRTEAQTQDAGFRRVFLADNPALQDALATADVVVVNGEGTLHGISQAAMNLLYVTNLAKTEFKKTVHLINTSLFPLNGGSSDQAIGTFYRDMLAPVDRIVIREPISLRQATDIGLDATLGFDCLPRYLRRKGFGAPPETRDDSVILGGGLGLDSAFFAEFLDDAKSMIGASQLLYVTGAQANVAQDDAKVLDVLRASDLGIEHRAVNSFPDWINLIGSASCLISGRFHHTIAATFLGTPAVTFEAGTPKINGLSEAFGFPAPINCTDQDALSVALERLRDIQDQRGSKLNESLREDLLRLSENNFVGL